MNMKNKVLIILLIIASCITLDQITKNIAQDELRFSAPKSYLGGFFVLKYAENTGAMLGFGSNFPAEVRFWFLTVLVGLLLLVLLAYLFWNKSLTKMQTIALALISGGGISNFIDRVVNNGSVVDFMHMDTGYGWLKTGIFNFADVEIMVGLGIMIVFGEWRQKPEKKESAAPEQEGEAPKPVSDS